MIRHLTRKSRLPKIVSGKSKIHDRGVFALEPIAEGTYITYYAGELVTAVESELRGDYQGAKGHIWIFDIEHGMARDAEVRGNVMRLVNHACRPSCYIDISRNTVWLVANRGHRARRGADVPLLHERLVRDRVQVPAGMQELPVKKPETRKIEELPTTATCR